MIAVPVYVFLRPSSLNVSDNIQKVVDVTSVNLFTADSCFEISQLHTNKNASEAVNTGGIIMHHPSKALPAGHKTPSCKSLG